MADPTIHALYLALGGTEGVEPTIQDVYEAVVVLGEGGGDHDHDEDYQPVASDLTAIAALTTTAFGRGLLEAANAAALRAAAGIGVSTVVQLAANVAMTDANTAYDVLSQVLDPGTYDLDASVLFDGNGNGGKGTAWIEGAAGAVLCSGQGYAAGGTGTPSIPLTATVTLVAQTTVKVRAASDGAATLIRAAASTNSKGNNASTFRARRTA